MTWLLLYPLPGLLFWLAVSLYGKSQGVPFSKTDVTAFVLFAAFWPALIPYAVGLIRGALSTK